MSALDIAACYQHCADVTRTSGTSFYYGIRLLPREQRQALSAIYAYSRRIDDIVDGGGSAAEKRASLALACEAFAHRDEHRDDPVLTALADTCRRFPIPLGAFDDLADGVAMDLGGPQFASFDELAVYCSRVGGSIGRLTVGVVGSSDRARALELSDALGVAFQLTNILRDVGEDLADGRVYLPQEDLEAFGCRLDSGTPNRHFHDLVRFETGRAGEWYATGLELIPLLERPGAASVAAMAGVYRRLLERIERDPEAVLTRRLSLPTWEKAWVTVRSVVGAAA